MFKIQVTWVQVSALPSTNSGPPERRPLWGLNFLIYSMGIIVDPDGLQCGLNEMVEDDLSLVVRHFLAAQNLNLWACDPGQSTQTHLPRIPDLKVGSTEAEKRENSSWQF